MQRGEKRKEGKYLQKLKWDENKVKSERGRTWLKIDFWEFLIF